MITLQQVKAARALLDWTQNDLAEASGVSLPVIARIEQGVGNPRADTLLAINAAFEKGGIEFNETTGVNLRRNTFKLDVYDGLSGAYRLWDDIVATLAPLGGGEILISGLSERVAIKRYGGERLNEEIERRRKFGIFPRLLMADGETLCVGSSEEYRTIPSDLFGEADHFVYADKYAMMTWDVPIKSIIIHSKSIADTYRKQFEFLWKMGKPIENPEIIYPITS